MSLENVSGYLAKNITQLRIKQSLSQAQLAKNSGIPRTTLTHIESGSGNPSLQNLVKISMALQVSIEELLSKPRNECEIIYENQIPVQKRSQGKARLHRLVPDKIKGLEVDKVEIDAKSTMAGHPHLQGAKEYLAVLKGVIRVYVAGEHYEVPENCVFAFPGDQPHSYRNDGPSHALAISIVIPVALGL